MKDAVLLGLCVRLAHGSPTRCFVLRLAFGAWGAIGLFGVAYLVTHAGACWSGEWTIEGALALVVFGAFALVTYLVFALLVSWQYRRPRP